MLLRVKRKGRRERDNTKTTESALHLSLGFPLHSSPFTLHSVTAISFAFMVLGVNEGPVIIPLISRIKALLATISVQLANAALATA